MIFKKKLNKIFQVYLVAQTNQIFLLPSAENTKIEPFITF